MAPIKTSKFEFRTASLLLSTRSLSISTFVAPQTTRSHHGTSSYRLDRRLSLSYFPQLVSARRYFQICEPLAFSQCSHHIHQFLNTFLCFTVTLRTKKPRFLRLVRMIAFHCPFLFFKLKIAAKMRKTFH